MEKQPYFAEDSVSSEEQVRLQALEAANDPATTRHLAGLGVTTGWHCLEVGAGAGSIVRWLSERVGPSGRVVAADIDTRFVERLDLPNVEPRRIDILRDAIEQSSFDLVHCRLLIIHLKSPLEALMRMVSAAKPWGWVMIEEADFSSYRAADPSHQLSAAFSAAVKRTFDNIARAGLFDPYYGCQVRRLMENAGLTEVKIEGSVYVRGGVESEAQEHLLSLPLLVKAGSCSAEDRAIMEAGLTDPDFRFVGHTIFSAWGRRADRMS